MLTDDQCDECTGFAFHEGCHKKHTDKQAWQEAERAGETIMRLTNGLEDARIERKEIAAGRLPGLKHVMAKTCEIYHRKSLKKAKDAGVVIGQDAGSLPYVLAMLGRLQYGADIPSAASLYNDVAPHLRPAVDHALSKLPDLASTRDALELARELADMIDKAKPSDRQAKSARRRPARPKAAKMKFLCIDIDAPYGLDFDPPAALPGRAAA